MKTLLCIVSKDLDNYIKEYVEYYINLGITNIIIYNNSTKNTYSDILKEYINSGYVILDNSYINKPFLTAGTSLQSILFTKCYKEYYNNYDWIIFLDDDEYIELEKYKTIDEYLSQDKFKCFDCIRLCWKIYNDNNIIVPTNYTIKNFTSYTSHRDNRICKSIIKCKHELVSKRVTSHGMYDINSCDALGNKCWCKSNHDNIYIGEVPILKDAWINHYRFKTLYEYINKKQKKLSNLNYSFNLYFEYNEKTPEKLAYLKSIGIYYE